MTKKTATLLFAMTFSCLIHAEKALMINGDVAEKNDISEITINGDELELKYADGSTFKLDMEAVEVKFFGTNSINATAANVYSINSFVDDYISLKNIEQGSVIQIIKTDGTVLYSAIANDVEMTINTDKLTPAPYLLKVGNQIIKFFKK
ncbi:MAG: hypothetical protein IJ916_11445 [Paludibacteraceae bacterium]|nr:hypothetical protein [Paludibacteraceae bacterium]